jgi:predicted nuclease with TOPRIM domain
LSTDDITVLRRQLAESQALTNEQKERLRQSHEETELLSRRRDELEARLSNLESEYEELLDKTIGDEERNSTETIQELKVRLLTPHSNEGHRPLLKPSGSNRTNSRRNTSSRETARSMRLPI